LAALRKGGRPTRQPPNRAGHHRRSLTGAWIEPQQALALRRLARFGPAALHVIDEGSQLRHYLPVAGIIEKHTWRHWRERLQYADELSRRHRAGGNRRRDSGIGDMLTGLFAVPAAIAVAAGTDQGRRAAIAWNIFGLADFAVAITLGFITSPGRFQLIVPDVLSIGAGAYPGVLTPAFVVPSSILLHAQSLRQLRRRSREVARR